MPRKKKANAIEENVAKPISGLVSLAIWITGILVSLAVGFGMIDGVLSIPLVHNTVTMIADRIVVVLTLVSVILAILDKLK